MEYGEYRMNISILINIGEVKPVGVVLCLQALYAVLPAVLESNPFINDVMTSSHSDLSEKTVDAVISIFHSTLTTMTEFALHPHIVSQLFCYLFFFTSTSLFNMLMKKGLSFIITSATINHSCLNLDQKLFIFILIQLIFILWETASINVSKVEVYCY